MLALQLREAGETERKLHKEDIARNKFTAALSLVEELLQEMFLAQIGIEEKIILRNSLKTDKSDKIEEEAKQPINKSNCHCRSKIKAYTFTNFLGDFNSMVE